MPEQHPYHDAMLEAVKLAQQARWQTFPNPCVGAVVMKDNCIVASGWHKGPGLAHAEVEALNDARGKGVDLADCVMVVTLEPCRHTGKTPPCTEAILASGLRRLVIGALDPNPKASGGAELLRSHGLHVETGVALEACTDLLDEFLTWQTTPLPYTLLKLAASLDGRIATRDGHSQWISSEESRATVHTLRQRVQAVVIGGNTFYADNPRLTCRAEGITEGAAQPLAVVLTSRLPEPDSDMYLVRERPDSLIFLTTAASAASPRAAALRGKGIRILSLPFVPQTGSAGGVRAQLDLACGLAMLRAEHACHYVLCEGGGRLGLAMLEKGLARELHLHIAPRIFADNDAIALFDGRSPRRVEDSLSLRLTHTAHCGSDLHLTLRPTCAPQYSDTGDAANNHGDAV